MLTRRLPIALPIPCLATAPPALQHGPIACNCTHPPWNCSHLSRICPPCPDLPACCTCPHPLCTLHLLSLATVLLASPARACPPNRFARHAFCLLYLPAHALPTILRPCNLHAPHPSLLALKTACSLRLSVCPCLPARPCSAALYPAP